MALRLAQHVSVGDGRVAGVPGHREGLRRLPLVRNVRRRAKKNLDAVACGVQLAVEPSAIAPEGVFRRYHRRAVQPDFGHRVELVDLEHPTFGLPAGGQVERTGQQPFAVGYPAQIVLVSAGVRIGDRIGFEQGRMHVSGNAHLDIMRAALFGEAP
jgi:hypothetical protein